MKKLAIALAALAVAATVASAAVFSQNAVGFINVEVEANELVCLTIPFNDMASTTGTVIFKNTQMAQDAAVGSSAYFWNGTGWTIANKTGRGFMTTKVLAPGEGMFFQTVAGDPAEGKWEITRPYDYPAAK